MKKINWKSINKNNPEKEARKPTSHWREQTGKTEVELSANKESSHYYLYSAFYKANCVKTALHNLHIKLGGFTSALQYLDREKVCRNSVILLWPDKISSLNRGCSKVRLCKGLFWILWSCPDGRLGDKVFTGDQSLVLILLSWSPLMFRAVEVIFRYWSTISSDTPWIRVAAVTIWSGYSQDLGGYVDLGIRKKQTNISIDAILLMM